MNQHTPIADITDEEIEKLNFEAPKAGEEAELLADLYKSQWHEISVRFIAVLLSLRQCWQSRVRQPAWAAAETDPAAQCPCRMRPHSAR